jgi:hypothetical protein
LVFILDFTLLIPSLFAQNIRWVTVEDSASMDNISKNEARSQAIENATRKAVQKVVGVNISAESLIVNLRLSGGIIGAIPYGKVIDKEIIEEGVTDIEKEGQIYKVKMRACVAEETKGIDPHFRLDVSLNKSIFKDNDEMVIKIKPTMDCYISIFNIFDDEKVLRLIPNRFMKDNFLKANKDFYFPNEKDKEKGITLRVHTPEKKKVVMESIYILALKQPFHLNDDKIQEGIFGIYNGKTAFMNELIKQIINLSLNERAEKLILYQVRKSR